jgi:hypothetical protein
MALRDLGRRLYAGQSAADDQNAAARMPGDGIRKAPARLGGVERMRVIRRPGDAGGVGPAARGKHQPVECQRFSLLDETERTAVEVDTGDRRANSLRAGAAEDVRTTAGPDGLPGGDLVPPGSFVPGVIEVDEDDAGAGTARLGRGPGGAVGGEQPRVTSA